MNKKYTRKNKGKGKSKSKSRSRTIKQKAATKIQRMTRKRLSRKQKALDKINKATIKLKRKKDVCPICLEKIDKKDRTETTCGHFFHRKCINKWCIEKVKKNNECNCPICKKNIPNIKKRAQKILEKRDAKHKKILADIEDDYRTGRATRRILEPHEIGRLPPGARRISPSEIDWGSLDDSYSN